MAFPTKFCFVCQYSLDYVIVYENGFFQVSVPKSQGIAKDIVSRSKYPTSPWMPFPMLFAAISKRISPSKMNQISSNYELFRVWLEMKV